MTQQNAYLRTFAAALCSSTLLWLAFPPVAWWWLAWVAPVPLIWLVAIPRLPQLQLARVGELEIGAAESKQAFSAGVSLSAKSHYWMLYLGGLAYWLATFYFIPFPHPALWLGWLAISLYMAVYTPLLVGVSRILVHRYRFPIVLAVPLVGTGLEWFRSVFLTGMPMVCLSHSQFRQPALIQVADLSGAYTLTFAIYMVAAGIAAGSLRFVLSWLAPNQERDRFNYRALLHWVLAVAVVLSVWGYGQFRLQHPLQTGITSLRVGLIQSSIDVVFVPLSKEEQYEQDLHYWELTQQALKEWPDLDLIIWPESSFPGYDLLSDFDGDASYTQADSIADIAVFWERVVSGKDVSLLVGGTTYDPAHETLFNSAIMIKPPGQVVGRYFKNHRVVFGEYVPFADQIPLLQNTPLGKGINAGREFKSFEIKGIRLAPCICFESAVPHLVRNMVNTLAKQNQAADVLVNQTNDGWFFGSSCLDLHLACNVFRSVETRKPMLVCANTGFSAEIDPRGRIQQVGPRRQPGILRLDVQSISGLSSLYLTIGDIVPMIFGLGSLLVVLIQWRSKSPPPDPGGK